MRYFNKTTILAGVASVLTLPVLAEAQGAETADDGMVFEEIIVTASRRAQTLQDVPAAVSAVTPDDFKFKGLKQISDVLEYTPGVSFAQTTGRVGYGSISARGIPQSSATPVFGIYVDDTPLSSNTNFASGGTILFDGLLLDIERLEIIKGPQGTLYGATSVGGMMRYISRDPALEELRVSAGADISAVRHGEVGQTYNGRVSVPLIKDKLGITLSGFYQDVPGYVDFVNPATGDVIEEDVDGGEVKGYAADVLFVPSDRFKLRMKYIKQMGDFHAGSGVLLANLESDAGAFGDYANINLPGDQSFDYEIVSGSLEYDLGWATLTSTSSYVEYDLMDITDQTAAYGPVIDFLTGQAPGTTTDVKVNIAFGSEKFVQEVRLTSERMGDFEWIAGLYYAEEDTTSIQLATSNPPFDLLYANFPSSYKEYAAFADVTYYFSDKFDVTAGGRISKNDIFLNFETSGLFIGTASTTTPTVKDTVDTYLFSARYRPSDNLSLYSRIASGYRPAQSNIPVVGANTPEVLAADNAWSYEIGAKGKSSDGTLKYDFALWMIDWSNFQAPLIVDGVKTAGNATDGISAHGFELSASVTPIDEFSLTANLAYSRSKLNSDEPGFGGVKGEQIPKLPKWSGSVQWAYHFDLAQDWFASLGGGVRYTGSFMSSYTNSIGVAPVKVDSRVITDLNLTAGNEEVTLNFYVTNLFDKRALVARGDNIISGTVIPGGIFERPRTVGVSAKVDF
ncbi:TonB-dependent receptor [Emcibacter sp.]|uniref:TonB-dependent receptor n=1 Tax=Emcibacter sp. TaxID=1979954 RepID=UPI002AA94056|nr:TonB-dependent receptor [Emcibacter sp.]